ncbi:MAG: microcin C ABC transporter permease YejB [Rhodospirillales bacterium]|nr:microcin C ABC transporter permease YejB [Alphaproteobacteria bacterium]MCB9987090.1 microcin C ABC transporter permease YejB [Rhodospirillales bacterium]USO08565.1 MAG: microcin C ABC transporter permease YejB [Rhodospirillales bacterium]
MSAYILRRLLLIIPTLFGIMLLNFLIVQAAPGGPVEQMIAKIQGLDTEATARFSGAGGDTAKGMKAPEPGSAGGGSSSKYRGAQGLDPAFIAELEKQFGFDKPLHERFFLMMKNDLKFDFGQSYYRDVSVTSLIVEKMPVSITLGLWSTLLIYLISIPLGIRKAVRDGSAFDVWSSGVIFVGYAIPSFLFAILLIILFAGGRYLDWFPLRGLTSDGWEGFPWWKQALDYLWHVTLPVASLVISGFAGLTMLTKNSFIDELGKQYVLTARAKGLGERRVLYGHVFRNAMLIVIAGFPGAFMAIFFTGNLLTEVIFSLDGMGLLGFESTINRDYPVMFGTLYVFTLMGLVLKIVSDITYVLVDPRIDFNTRAA